ncbi:MAG: sugar nucleotide-binding protein [Rhodospirillaceae bacterium]|nr:sugar nucleotide-binding protein [Rhodospirillaceae bacterium]
MPLPKILLLGATGLVGRALLRVAGARGIAIVGAARTGADIMVDVTRDEDLAAVIERSGCGLVVNATMSGGIEACHRDPGGTYLVDGRAVRILTELCRRRGMPFVHLSTDHFFTGDGAARHDESAPVVLVNDYAAGKYAGERFALTYPRSLVIRTNVAGHRGWAGRPTFAEWAVAALAGNQEITGFSDYHCSTIDSDSLAHAILDLTSGGASGLLNVGATEVASKYAFLDALARRLGLPDRCLVEGSVAGLVPRRAESLGLDVSKAEGLLGRRLPTLEEVVDHLARSIAGA